MPKRCIQIEHDQNLKNVYEVQKLKINPGGQYAASSCGTPYSASQRTFSHKFHTAHPLHYVVCNWVYPSQHRDEFCSGTSSTGEW